MGATSGGLGLNREPSSHVAREWNQWVEDYLRRDAKEKREAWASLTTDQQKWILETFPTVREPEQTVPIKSAILGGLSGVAIVVLLGAVASTSLGALVVPIALCGLLGSVVLFLAKQKSRGWGVLIGAIVLLIGGQYVANQAARSVPNDTDPSPSLRNGVIVELEIESLESKRPVIAGRTNLPDGTVLVTSIDGQTFWGSEDLTVARSTFRGGPFGPASGLPAGNYTASVTMQFPRLQTIAVRRIIGQKGEKLKGQLVDQDEVFGATVSVKKQFQLGSNREVEEQQRRQKERVAEAKSILRQMKALVRRGREMEAFRVSLDDFMKRRMEPISISFDGAVKR